MRKMLIAVVLVLSGCSSEPQKQVPCPQPRAMPDGPQRNSIVLERENLIPVHVSYVDLPYIDAGAVLQTPGGEHVLVRGTPPDNRAHVSQIDQPYGPPPPPRFQAPTPQPLATPIPKPKPKVKAVHHKAPPKPAQCDCPADSMLKQDLAPSPAPAPSGKPPASIPQGSVQITTPPPAQPVSK